jgi:hypothetical protein
LLTVEAWV